MASYPELRGKVAVVSGAGGNLGYAVVRRLGAEGVRVAAIDRNADRLRQRLNADGLGDVVFEIGPVDLTRKADVDAFISRVGTLAQHIDILVNVAGGFKFSGPIHELDEAAWDDMMSINTKTTLLLSAAVARHMVTAGTPGRIISVASRGGLSGIPSLSAYSASKAAAIRLTESLAGELMAHNITANVVLPSTIDTPQNRAGDPKADYSKWVSPESLADVIAFLASDSARDISGAAIPVYGRA